MDIQFIKLEDSQIEKLNIDPISSHKIILDPNKEIENNEEKKIRIDNSDFITVNDTDNILIKSELEISTEFIIDEDNFNISPNTTTDPCVDPLAIDDFNAEEITSNLNDSQFNLSKDNIIYIVDVDDIKDNSLSEPTINSIKISSLTDIHNKITRNDQNNDENNINLIRNGTKSTNNDENEMPSDGSDSGLGLESNSLQLENYSKLHNIISITDKNHLSIKIPTKSSLKRKSGTLEESILPAVKRGKKSIQFDNVKIFYFPRIQGFCCVPSQGGCTLGMGAKHVQSKTYKMSDHVSEQNGDEKLSMQLCNAKGSSSDETDSDEDLSEENTSDLDPDSSGFLQPVPVKTRRAILKAAGIKKIDSSEKNECRAIRSSREYCGCLCRDFCDPDTCSCSQNGIKCQVDRPNFPCGCSRDGCANIHGRIEFNPSRVRTHFIHTVMRLEIENKSKSTFIQEIPTTPQRFFPNANPTDVIYEGESSTMIQNGLQFFPDTISVINNDNNFDLFALHNGVESRVALMSSTTDMNVTGELSYPGLKSFLSPINNYQHNETIDSSKLLKLPRNNKISTCVNNDVNESSYSGNYTHNFDSFSSAYTNFLQECESAYQPSKDSFIESANGEISVLNSSNLNYNQNSLEVSPVHDLLNINRNNSLPLYSINSSEIVPKSNETIKFESNSSTITNLENVSSVTKLCTLAPTAHTSTSISEGTSTTVVSNYVSSPCNFEQKNISTFTTSCTSTVTTNSISKLEPNVKISIAQIHKQLDESIFSDSNLKTEISHCDLEVEKICLPSPPLSVSVIQENSTKTLTNSDTESNVTGTKDEIKKQYRSFNLTND